MLFQSQRNNFYRSYRIFLLNMKTTFLPTFHWSIFLKTGNQIFFHGLFYKINFSVLLQIYLFLYSEADHHLQLIYCSQLFLLRSLTDATFLRRFNNHNFNFFSPCLSFSPWFILHFVFSFCFSFLLERGLFFDCQKNRMKNL